MVVITTVGSANINPSGWSKGEDGSSSSQIRTPRASAQEGQPNSSKPPAVSPIH